MIRLKSIFTRILIVFIGFIATQALVMGLAGYYAAQNLSENLLEKRSILLLDTLIQAERHNRSGRDEQLEARDLIEALHLNFLVGKQIPPEYASLPDGFHISAQPGRFIFLKRHDGIPYALEGPLEHKRTFMDTIGKMFFFCAVAALLAAIILAFYLSDRIARPIRRLTLLLNTSTLPEKTSLPSSFSRRKDEIGTLAAAIIKFQRDARDNMEREKFFTRAAGHELRTPLAVIANGLEILESRIPAGRERELLERLLLTTSNMEAMTATLLCLARNEGPSLSRLDLPPVFFNVLSAFATGLIPLEAPKSGFIDMKISLRGNRQARVTGCLSPVMGNAKLAEVIFQNLLQNALSHSLYGDIFIHCDGDKMEIGNMGGFKPAVQEEARFGLLIAERACEQMGWRLGRTGDEKVTIFTIQMTKAP